MKNLIKSFFKIILLLLLSLIGFYVSWRLILEIYYNFSDLVMFGRSNGMGHALIDLIRFLFYIFLVSIILGVLIPDSIRLIKDAFNKD